MDLRQLEHFVTVAEEKHFTRASERLFISQSGLSASIRALEKELEAELFDRNTRRVELTDAGQALLEESRRTLASVLAARDAVAAVQGLRRGRLRVGTEQCLGAVDVPRELAHFHAEHPGVELLVQQAGSARLVDEVHTGRLDVAFVAGPTGAPEDVRFVRLASEPMTLVCRPEHELRRAGSGSTGKVCATRPSSTSTPTGAPARSPTARSPRPGSPGTSPRRSTTSTPCSTSSSTGSASPSSPSTSPARRPASWPASRCPRTRPAGTSPSPCPPAPPPPPRDTFLAPIRQRFDA